MRQQKALCFRAIATLLAVVTTLSSSGCAAIFRGTSESVTVNPRPAGQAVYYGGRKLTDGDSVTVQKRMEEPMFQAGPERNPVPVKMSYQPDPWLIGDAAWLLLGIVPGVIALGIDFATGAWRNLDSPQLVVAPIVATAEIRNEPGEAVLTSKSTLRSTPAPTHPVEPFAQPIQP